MRISPTAVPSKPTGDGRVPEWTLGYFRTRNKYRVYSLVIDELEKSGISQATLARRLGKGPDLVYRWLGSPGNWTLDTLSDFLFATSGAESGYSILYPLDTAASEEEITSTAREASPQAMRSVGKKSVNYDTSGEPLPVDQAA